MTDNFDKSGASNYDKWFPIKDSRVDCTEMMGLIILILNIFTGSLGTLISAFVDKQGTNKMALLVWLV